ncbi:hypothetical protein EPN52_01245 [bacterium]|nr:MAG: hypothetical protein EPN52_01245 [bacterium]
MPAVHARRAVAGTGFALLLGALLTAAPAHAGGIYIGTVPNVPEAAWTANCGPAALTDVLQFYDPSIAYDAIFARVYNRMTNSTFTVRMAEEAASLHFHVRHIYFASAADPHFELLARELAQGRPVIVAGTASVIDTAPHFRVVVGLDDRDVWMVDPLYGPGYVLSRVDFRRTLEGGSNEYLVVWRGQPPERLREVVSTTLPRWPAPTAHQLAVRALERAYDRAQSGDPAGAARELEREEGALTATGDRRLAAAWVGVWAARAGLTRLALQAFDASLYRDDAALRARLLLERGEVGRARALLEPAAVHLDAAGWLELGDARRLMEDREGALAAYRHARELDDAGRLADALRWRMTLVAE